MTDEKLKCPVKMSNELQKVFVKPDGITITTRWPLLPNLAGTNSMHRVITHIYSPQACKIC